ncbi:unnamed protein product, partial [Polarella glacialis]
VALGTFASKLLEAHQRRVSAEKLDQRISSGELAYVKHLLGVAGDEIQLSEYIQIQLLRMNAIDANTLNELRASFERLDIDGSGSISRDFLMRQSKRKIERLCDSHGLKPTFQNADPAEEVEVMLEASI